MNTQEWVKRQSNFHLERLDWPEFKASVDHNQRRFEVLCKYAKPRMRMLDAGCHAGCVAEEMHRRGLDVTAVDLPDVVESIDKKEGITYYGIDLNGGNGITRRLDGKVIDQGGWPCRAVGVGGVSNVIVPERYNLIFSGETIEHLYNDFDFLKRCYNGLVEGGLLILSAPFYYPDQDWSINGGMHIRVYPARMLDGLVQLAGFEIIETDNVQILDNAGIKRNTGRIVVGRKE